MVTRATHYARPRRSNWYTSALDGVSTSSKSFDSKYTDSWDFSDELGDGETLSSVTTRDAGVTLTNVGVSGTVLTWTVTGTGEFTADMVDSSGGILQKKFRYRGKDRRVRDYRGP